MTTIITLNRGPSARPALKRCPLYYAPGERPKAQGLAIGGYAAVPYEQTYWPDGSVRALEAHWWMMVPPGVTEHRCATGNVPKDIHLAQVWAGPKASMALAAAEKSFEFATGGEPCAWEWEMTFESGLLWNAIGYARTPNGMWAELHAEGHHGAPFIRFAWHYGWNDRSPENHKQLPPSTIKVTGLKLGIWEHEQKTIPPSGIDMVTVCNIEDWNDGQSQLIRGVLMLEDADPIWHEELLGPCIAFQKDALATGAFGLLGRIPTAGLPVVSSEEAQAWAEGELAKRPKGDPWQAPIWHTTEPGQTGDRRAFGLVGPAAALFGNAPQALELARFGLDQEACRPIWFRSAVHNRFLTNAESQKVVYWNERPHMYGEDKLGKTESPNLYVSGARSQKGEIWWGRDRQHGEDVSEVGYLMLTGDPVSKHMAEQRVERLLGELRTDTGNPTVDSMDSGRGSRALSMLCRYSEVFPKRELIRDRIRERITLYDKSWRESGLAALPVCPQQYYGPSNQAGGLPIDHWRPWEDAEAVKAMVMAWMVTGDPRARALAAAWSWNIIENGFVQEPDGRWEIGVAVAWNGGQKLTAEQQRDPAWFKLGHGTAYRTWAYVAGAFAWNTTHWAVADGSLSQAKAGPRLQRIGAILAQLRAAVPQDVDGRLELQELLAIELVAMPVPGPIDP